MCTALGFDSERARAQTLTDKEAAMPNAKRASHWLALCVLTRQSPEVAINHPLAALEINHPVAGAAIR
jgi:hypothetical protein